MIVMIALIFYDSYKPLNMTKLSIDNAKLGMRRLQNPRDFCLLEMRALISIVYRLF
jgi:hypothetical protein